MCQTLRQAVPQLRLRQPPIPLPLQPAPPRPRLPPRILSPARALCQPQALLPIQLPLLVVPLHASAATNQTGLVVVHAARFQVRLIARLLALPTDTNIAATALDLAPPFKHIRHSTCPKAHCATFRVLNQFHSSYDGLIALRSRVICWFLSVVELYADFYQLPSSANLFALPL